MAFYGPVAFEWYVILAALSLVCSYGILHIILQLRVHLPRVEQIKDREQMVEEDSEVDQNKVQDLLSNISPLDTTDRIRLRSVSISRGRARSLSQPRMRSESQPMFMANYGSIVYEN